MITDKQQSMLEHLLSRSGIAPKEEWTLPNGIVVKSIQPTMDKVKNLTVAEASEIISLFASWEQSGSIRDLDLPRFTLIQRGIIV